MMLRMAWLCRNRHAEPPGGRRNRSAGEGKTEAVRSADGFEVPCWDSALLAPLAVIGSAAIPTPLPDAMGEGARRNTPIAVAPQAISPAANVTQCRFHSAFPVPDLH